MVMAVSVMWRGIRVNLLYRRPGAASARLMSVVAFEAAALARKGVFVKGLARLRQCLLDFAHSLLMTDRAEPLWSFR